MRYTSSVEILFKSGHLLKNKKYILNMNGRQFKDNRTGEVVKVIDSYENIAILENRQKIDELYADNLRLVDERAGLFDSRATPSDCSVPTVSTTAPKPVAAPSCARLSNSLTQLLLTESKRADEAANYAMTCYEWVKKLGVK